MGEGSVVKLTRRELRCVECGELAVAPADGWKAYIGGGYESEPLEVLVYCPWCNLREFGRDAAA